MSEKFNNRAGKRPDKRPMEGRNLRPLGTISRPERNEDAADVSARGSRGETGRRTADRAESGKQGGFGKQTTGQGYTGRTKSDERRKVFGKSDRKGSERKYASYRLNSSRTSRAQDEYRETVSEAETEGIESTHIEGRNAVLEAFRSGKTIEKLFVQDACKDGPIQTIVREAKKNPETILNFVSRERLDELSETGHHQGVIAYAAAYAYSEVTDMLAKAKEKGEDPFLILLDGIEDPHNLGAIIRTANQAGAHGVIITKHRACGLTATVAKSSAGALNYTPVARVTNLGQTIEELKKEGLWFACADMGDTPVYKQNLKGPIGLVIGNEGDGVSRLVKEKCDLVASIPMKGDIDSLNASVAAGILAFEIVRQRMG